MKKGLFAKSKTFKPRKQHAKGTKRYELHKKAKVTLGSGDLRQAVQLPAGEELNEWLAVNTVVSTLHQTAQIKLTPTEQPQDFFNQVNLLYGSITVFCTATTCPVSNSFLFGLFSAWYL